MTVNSEKRSNIYLVIGLGNPGPAYSGNRHNVGFMVVDRLARDKNRDWKTLKNLYESSEVRDSGMTMHLLKPMTFMNLSGKAVANFISRKFIDLNNIVVIHDDMDLTFGKIRLKKGGGDGGHRGVRSIADSLRFKDFIRIRIGVGRPPSGVSPEAYVLQNFSDPFQKENIEQLVDNGVFATVLCICEGIETAQQKISSRTMSKPEPETMSL